MIHLTQHEVDKAIEACDRFTDHLNNNFIPLLDDAKRACDEFIRENNERIAKLEAKR